MKKIYNITISVLAIFLFQISAFSQTKPLIDLVETPSGSYYMGREDKGENYDEIPAYKVNISKTFRMGVVEVANVQYEKFRLEHKKLHGKDNVSVGDDDAVVNVSYQDAVDFSRDYKEVSFTDYPQRTRKEDWGIEFTDVNGNKFKGYGMYAALSYGDGKTWPVKRLLVDGKERHLNGGAWTGDFDMDAIHVELNTLSI